MRPDAASSSDAHDCQLLVCIEGVRHWDAKVLSERFVQGATDLLLVDLSGVSQCQILSPGPVIQYLSDDLSRRAVALELNDVYASVSVHAEYVDEPAELRGNLSPHHKDGQSDQAGIVGDHVFKPLLEVELGGRDRYRPL